MLVFVLSYLSYTVGMHECTWVERLVSEHKKVPLLWYTIVISTCICSFTNPSTQVQYLPAQNYIRDVPPKYAPASFHHSPQISPCFSPSPYCPTVLLSLLVNQLRVGFLGNTLPFADSPESAIFILLRLQLCKGRKKEKVETFSNSTTNHHTLVYTTLLPTDRSSGKTASRALPGQKAIFCLGYLNSTRSCRWWTGYWLLRLNTSKRFACWFQTNSPWSKLWRITGIRFIRQLRTQTLLLMGRAQTSRSPLPLCWQLFTVVTSREYHITSMLVQLLW